MRYRLLAVGVAGAVFMGGLRDAAGADRPAAEVTDMSDLVVTSARREMPLRDTPDIVQVISRRKILEIQPSSTGELLRYITGSAVTTGTGAGLPDRGVISLNGLPPPYTLVLVDGIPLLTEHIHTGQNVDLIPPHSIERIEVMRGAASAQYGSSAVAGVVNIVTRRCGEHPELSVHAAAGRYDTFEGGVSLLAPLGAGLRLSSLSNWEQSGGMPIKAPLSRVGQTGYERLNLLNRLDGALGENASFFASLNRVENKMDWQKGTADSTLTVPVIGISARANADLDIAARASYSDWEADANLERNTLFAPEANARWRVSERHTLMAGVDAQFNEFERRAVPKADRGAIGAFLQDEWNNGGALAAMAALRFDDVEDVESTVSPKLSVMIEPADAVRLRASAARGFRAPSLQELYEEGFGHSGRAYRFGNPDLQPEYSTTCTAGIELQPAAALTVLLHSFYSDLDDMIVPVYEGPWAKNPAVDVWRRTNIENAEVYGGEAGVRLALGERAALECGYTYTKNRDKETGRRLPYSPGQSLFGRLTASQPLSGRLSLGAFLAVRADYDREAWNWKPDATAAADNPNGLTTPLADCTKFDAGLTLNSGRDWEAYVKVENILGEDIENLEDAYTVLHGEPVLMVGLRYNLPLRP